MSDAISQVGVDSDDRRHPDRRLNVTFKESGWIQCARYSTLCWQQMARKPLAQVGLTQWENNLANNMSGGQQQRVAIAIAMNPALILADEPTGNLDTKSANAVFGMMQQVNQTNGTTFLLVTHNMDLARRCHRIVEVVDGRIVTPSPVRGST